MTDNLVAKHARAFSGLLFLHPQSENMRSLNLLSRTVLYILALVFFYVPIFYFAAKSTAVNHELILYYIAIGAVHILSRVMLYNSKRIQKRFSTVKSRKNFLLRTWLVIEYIIFMWLVYLFYPLSCILVPFSLLTMSFESFLGYSAFLNLFSSSPEQFIMIGGIISYILFILADGYKKLKTGFLPDYLGLYALLSIISSAVEGGLKNIFIYLNLDISNVTSVLSEIFSLSNNSMNIVASAMTVIFAIYSLYTSRGTTGGDLPNNNSPKDEIGAESDSGGNFQETP